MDRKINQIKNLIKKECQELGFIDKWFYKLHLLGVEKSAQLLLDKLPKADKELVFLGVWLHDLQRVRGLKGDHAIAGAKAEKVLNEFKYPEQTIKKVVNIIETHPCKGKLMPNTLEGKILASADAMSHYYNDFYLTIAIQGDRTVDELRKWALEKLDRDYNKKIFFPFAKKMIKGRHDVLMNFFRME